MQLNQYIDHTNLKPTATPADIEKLCREAVSHNFYAVCVNGHFVNLAKKQLRDFEVKLAAVVGFPLGANTTQSKVFEAREAISNGADEIDMVINLGMLKSGDFAFIEAEIYEIKKAIGNKVLKVILETCYLNQEEIKQASKAALKARANFVKTSTGFGSRGASLEDVRIMKEVVGDKLEIKASGGIKDKETALQYLELGVTRIGTSSGVAIIS
ncbi:deoxyribose-phosphate aldolase [Salegentibacter sp. HM20]